MIIIIILWTVFLDSLRDGLEGSWLKTHIVKWLQFYPIIIYLMIVEKLIWWLWIVLAIISWGIWQLSIRFICHKNWTSIWIKLYRKIKRKKQ